MVLDKAEMWKILVMVARSSEFRGRQTCVLASDEFEKASTRLKEKFIRIGYSV